MALASTVDPSNRDSHSIIRAKNVAGRLGTGDKKATSGSERKVETTTIQLSHGNHS
jgi:hypothetical protein